MRAKEAFWICTPDQPLEALCAGPGIPLLLMDHLRWLDFLISREVSYERTVDDFLLQLSMNDALRDLRARQDMVILLNEEGALVREGGAWFLYFTPNRSERRTLMTEGGDLYEAYRKLLERCAAGAVCRVAVPHRGQKALAARTARFCILDEFCTSQPGSYLAVAEEIVLSGPDHLFRNVPVCRYGDLSTVDLDEIESYHAVRSLMDEYVYAYDHPIRPGKAPKPISIAVFGPPGSGKSFGVKQIANSRGRFAIHSLNLSQCGSPGELFSTLEKALQYEGGKIPLIFFDEFDSELAGLSRGWLKYFLAPMQDGEFTLEGRTVPINGAVFVFAGGTAPSFEAFQPRSEEEALAFQRVKGPDFVSRLKGILNIKGPNPVAVTDRRHMIRRALLLREQFLHQARNFYDPDTGRVNISQGLLRTLLRVSEFRHGSRSMEFILGMSRLAGSTRYTPSCLPLAEQLDIHLDVKDFMSKLAFEQMMGDVVNDYARIAHEHYRTQRIRDAQRFHLSPEEIARIQAEDRMAGWDELKEKYKENRRSQIRYLVEHMERYDLGVGLRPILPGASDTIFELYGPILERLSELEHRRWLRDKARDGWSLGKLDSQLKHHPDMVPYDQLEESVKGYIRMSVRCVPDYLRQVGYELYRKIN